MMNCRTVKQLINSFNQELESFYPKEEIRNFTGIILAHLLGFSRTDMLIKTDYELGEADRRFCMDALLKLKQQVPIQYIVGHTLFYGLTFYVDKNVLIPRPETEELVQWIIQDTEFTAPAILDIGTGSGCIPIALKKHMPQAKVTAWDISPKAITLAKRNAKANNVEIDFNLQDVLAPNIEISRKYDIIVSNPPYVRELEKKIMQDNVLKHEPHLALFVKDNDPLLFYRAISKLATQALNANGRLYFEINEALGKQTSHLMRNMGFKEVELGNDIFGKNRMVKGSL
ncbi:release factor glutamine methyltransferase [Saccharicrinis carchari]|uniref:Release factor glutamine methyltransferase n=1 Tax=Saccharicrinis carchari TaxID=1168039 RepID=A0A521CJ40_SACCC|nr:peptide chain release factor N(5)-glutamine methyltransferase [Saccharicrinis carchari]SMO59448.1 release factor glutamine methyltransferase [Saccharicrinis carchari]